MGKVFSSCANTSEKSGSHQESYSKPIENHTPANNTPTTVPPLDAEDGKHEIEETSKVEVVLPCDIAPPLSLVPSDDFVNFTILFDKDTIDYVKISKVMIILKGLPGSGKSRISRRVMEVYEDTVVCCADDFFIQDGVYKFDPEKLKYAHQACQEKTQEAVESGHHVVVIDNTNVRAWESKYYLQLSGQHQYVPLILEPRTPWAKDAALLAQRNSHGVPEEVLQEKVKNYEPALPLYYWWYLNGADSEAVVKVAQEWLRKALLVPQFFQDFSEFSKLSDIDDMLKYFGKSQQSGGYGLHATASVTRRGKAEGAMDYINNPVVKQSLGKCFDLFVIGYVITPRAFGARLRLGERELEVWNMNDIETEPEESHSAGSRSLDNVVRPIFAVDNEAEKSQMKVSNLNGDCIETVKIITSQSKENRFCPTSGKGSRAHLTIGCAPEIHAKVTGFDLINVVSLEQMAREDDAFAQKVKRYNIDGGALSKYDDGVWVVYPEQELVVRSLFSGYY